MEPIFNITSIKFRLNRQSSQDNVLISKLLDIVYEKGYDELRFSDFELLDLLEPPTKILYAQDFLYSLILELKDLQEIVIEIDNTINYKNDYDTQVGIPLFNWTILEGDFLIPNTDMGKFFHNGIYDPKIPITYTTVIKMMESYDVDVRAKLYYSKIFNDRPRINVYPYNDEKL